MHQTAYNWIAKTVRILPVRRKVLEFGSRDVNGTPRRLFQDAECYVGVDLIAGPGVDIEADASTFTTQDRFDTVICMEVLEHTDKAREICRNAYHHLTEGGVFLVTAASYRRQPHSAVDGGELKEGEFYRNVTRADLRFWMSDFRTAMIRLSKCRGDIYAIGVK